MLRCLEWNNSLNRLIGIYAKHFLGKSAQKSICVYKKIFTFTQVFLRTFF